MKDLFSEHYSDDATENELLTLMQNGVFQNDSRDLLSEFKYPSIAQRKALWDDCIFVFDASALLHIYQMPPHLRDGYMEILKALDKRIWIPYHAAVEYHSNLAKSVAGACSPSNDLRVLKGQVTEYIKASFKHYGQWHWLTDSCFIPMKQELDLIIKHADEHRSSIISNYQETKEQLSALFQSKIGAKYTDEQLASFLEESKRRALLGTPPYCPVDAKKKENQYGDIVVWLQIIEFAKTEQKPIIFIIDDNKENWFLLDNVGQVGVRPELCLEITRIAKVQFWAYSSISFIEYAQEHLKLTKTSALKKELEKAKFQEQETIKLVTQKRENYINALQEINKVTEALEKYKPDLVEDALKHLKANSFETILKQYNQPSPMEDVLKFLKANSFETILDKPNSLEAALKHLEANSFGTILRQYNQPSSLEDVLKFLKANSFETILDKPNSLEAALKQLEANSPNRILKQHRNGPSSKATMPPLDVAKTKKANKKPKSTPEDSPNK